jgi:hypothetical protein
MEEEMEEEEEDEEKKFRDPRLSMSIKMYNILQNVDTGDSEEFASNIETDNDIEILSALLQEYEAELEQLTKENLPALRQRFETMSVSMTPQHMGAVVHSACALHAKRKKNDIMKSYGLLRRFTAELMKDEQEAKIQITPRVPGDGREEMDEDEEEEELQAPDIEAPKPPQRKSDRKKN